jgi:5-methyltetrahydropteroyltriglutamate--homocysteine methyltransferase
MFCFKPQTRVMGMSGDRVIAGSDCGFGTFAGFGAVDPEIAYAKLKSLSQGAAQSGS